MNIQITILTGIFLASHCGASPVILNEFNAVGNSRNLAGDSVDVFFDRRDGNGGDWFELVVTGTGRGSTVDLRGWKIQAARSGVTPFVADDTLELSNDPFWAAVPAGTILTFTESRESEGGMDTTLYATDRFEAEGWGHSNIWIGDPNLITYTDPATNGYEIDPVLGVNGYNLNEVDTQLRILNAASGTVFGPAGEGIGSTANTISDEEVFALQQTPGSQITPDSDYGDTSRGTDQLVFSTFGEPNQWWVAGTTSRQSFEAFRPGAVAPVILSSQRNITLTVGDNFSSDVTAFDADGESLTLSLVNPPAFLELVDPGNGSGTLSGQPGTTDTGTTVVGIKARDASGNEHLQSFVITVLPTESPIIINEYNAVSSDGLLGAEWSFDQRFDLRKGNGDDWIELVVTGDGTPGGTVDLRQWKIMVEEDGFPAGSITLSDDVFWANVQNGTILTFSESNFNQGGWDTQIDAEDRFATEGWGWSNIFLGDAAYVDQSAGFPALGITGDETRITILDSSGQVRAGPFGEGLFSANSIGDSEVFRLTNTPSPSLSPLNPGFTDGEASAFGHPNRLPEEDGTTPGLPAGTSTGYQSFRAFATGPGSASPYFTNLWGTPVTNNTLSGRSWNGPLLTAADPDNNETTLAFSITTGPAGLVLVNNGDGSATWSWTPGPNDLGTHAVTVRVSDPGGSYLNHTLKIAVIPPASPILVNEYNAVSSSRFLNEGTLAADIDGGTAGDSILGRVEGNGGDWLELVVVGDGTADSTVDLRGWTIEIRENFDFTPETIVLSQDPYWSNVRAGTILTFMDRGLASGGLDSGIHRINRFGDLGYAWTNIALRNAELIDRNNSSFGSSITINSSDTEITLKDSNGTIQNGPVGEPRIERNINSNEIFHLEANPGPNITSSVAESNFPLYADNSGSSSLGTPNSWNGDTTTQTQDFTAFASTVDTNSRPVFVSLPENSYVLEGTTVTRPIGADDFDGTNTLSFPNTATPFWVSVIDNGNGEGSLTWSPPAGTFGFQTITVQVSDGIDTVSRSFEIFVHRANPPVLLNEYNAVSSSNYLNDGSLSLDSEGGAAADPRFGRIAGNGGDWFELVVVGDGQPGTTDLRGWRIEVAENAGFPFQPGAVIEFSQDPFWASVSHGTILTFTEERAVEGGWDTAIRAENPIFSEGWSWSNIWIGDPQLLTYTSEAFNGFGIGALDGRVTNFDVGDDQTQFVIRDQNGAIVAGPAGEGIGLPGGIENTNLWRLIGDPDGNLTPYEAGVPETNVPGATISPRTSTFGRPNLWNTGNNHQNFSTFITPYGQYITALGLTGEAALPSADPDLDGFDNALEFALGSSPRDPSDQPTLQVIPGEKSLLFLRRTGGMQSGSRYQADLQTVIVEASGDLQNWTETPNQSTSPNGLPAPPEGYEYVVFTAPEPLIGENRLFYRIRVTSPEGS